ncbi:hypothetical protein IT414_00935 [bacterium]|nr:hypothetical protein [bacterium]
MGKIFSDIVVSVPPDVAAKSFTTQGNLATTIINTIIFVIGSGSVIMIIVGALMYVVSAGDQNKLARAKDTILYAVVGVVLAVLGYAIVTFIIGRL